MNEIYSFEKIILIDNRIIITSVTERTDFFIHSILVVILNDLHSLYFYRGSDEMGFAMHLLADDSPCPCLLTDARARLHTDARARLLSITNPTRSGFQLFFPPHPFLFATTNCMYR